MTHSLGDPLDPAHLPPDPLSSSSSYPGAVPRDATYDADSDPIRQAEFSQTLTVSTAEKPTLAKAIVAGVTALSGALITALADNGITATEWVTVVVATVVAAASVYAVTNKRT